MAEDHHQLPSSAGNSTALTARGGAAAAAAAAEAYPSRRPRGRPQGSKNKAKLPVVVTRDSALRSHVLEVSAGSDVALALTDYARRRGRGLSLLYGSGAVDNVSLKQPGGGVATLRGRSDIISITGNILPPPAPPGSSCLTVFLDGSQGQVVGGSIMGRLMAASTVVVVATSFANAVYEKLPIEEEHAEAEAEVEAEAAPREGSAISGDY